MRHRAASLLLVPLAALGACAKRAAPPPPSTGPTPSTVRVVTGNQQTITFSGVSEDEASNTTLDVPVDRAWPLLPSVYQELGVDFTTLDQRNRRIANDALRARRTLGGTPLTRYVDCGSSGEGARAATYDVVFSVATQLTPAGEGKTAVATLVQATARSPMHSNSEVTCGSTRQLERRIAALLRVKAAAAQ